MPYNKKGFCEISYRRALFRKKICIKFTFFVRYEGERSKRIPLGWKKSKTIRIFLEIP